MGPRFQDAGRLAGRARRCQGSLPGPVVSCRVAAGPACKSGPTHCPATNSPPMSSISSTSAEPQADEARGRPDRFRFARGSAGTRTASISRYQKTDRGHQRFRLVEVDTHTGSVRNMIDEKSQTFIWTAHARKCAARRWSTGWRSRARSSTSSERDGWRHLYLIDAKTRHGQEPDHQRTVRRAQESIGSTKTLARSGFMPAARTPIRTRISFITIASISTAQNLVALTEGDGSHSRPVFSRSPFLDR